MADRTIVNNPFTLGGDETCQQCGENENPIIVLDANRWCWSCWRCNLEDAGYTADVPDHNGCIFCNS